MFQEIKPEVYKQRSLGFSSLFESSLEYYYGTNYHLFQEVRSEINTVNKNLSPMNPIHIVTSYSF